MKPEIPLKGGDEQDAFTGWRRFMFWQKGKRRKTKRQYWKRVRRWTKGKLTEVNDGEV